MKIIIETDERQASVVEKTSTEERTTVVTATDAGTPSATLLQAVGRGPVEVMPSQGKTLTAAGAGAPVTDGIDGGTPPDWLVQAIENSPSGGLVSSRFST